MSKYTNRPSTPGTIALAIWVVSSLLALVSGLALAIGGGAADVAGIETADGESTAILAATGIVVVVLNLFMIFIAVRMWRGAMWAQWTLTVLGVGSLATLHTGAGQELLVWMHTLAVIVAIVLMWAQPTAIRNASR